MTAKAHLLGLIAASVMSSTACANDERAYEQWLIRVGDYETLARSWWSAAESGDADKQERLADLYLGPHARQAKARPHEGIHYLFRAAVNGRPGAMRRLADAAARGAFGLEKRPDAARCWSGTPASFEGRLACVRLTDFRVPGARVSCPALAVAEAHDNPGTRDGAAMARLCLANKTPAYLVPGHPPGPQEIRRIKEYERHGIDWVITGDVYEEEFERFRGTFNRTIVAALDAGNGQGYFDKLSRRIEARIARK